MKIDIVRAWKDAAYRESLSDEELALVPQNPAGAVELSDSDLINVVGGNGSHSCCQAITVCNSVVCKSVVCHTAIGVVCTVIGVC